MFRSVRIAWAGLLLVARSHGATPILDLPFNDSSNLLASSPALSITATGPITRVDEPNAENVSARIPKGSSIAVLGGVSRDRYTLLLDVRIPALGGWRSLLQTSPRNTDDADLFINPAGAIGLGVYGYTTKTMQAGAWHRIVLAYDKGGRLDLFLDGQPALSGVPGSDLGRLSLDTLIHFFADNDLEQEALDVARIAIFPTTLGSQQIADLGSPHDLAFTAPPWLQNVSDTAITIMWESNLSASGLVRYGTGTSLDRSASSISTNASSRLYVHKARLSGLSPSTTYAFGVSMGFDTSARRSFTTAPPTGSGSVKFGVWGDSHYPHPALEMFRYMTDTLRVDFAASTGDVSNHGYDPLDLKANFVPNTLLGVGSKVPFFIATGDHDAGLTVGNIYPIRHYFDQPKGINSDSNGISGSYVAFYGPVAMIFIDFPRIETDIPGWLDRQLKSDAVRNSPFVFTFIHRAPYYERWQAAGENSHVKIGYPPVVEANGVDASFSGHMHGYERGFRNGTYYITTGGGSYLDVNESVGTNYDFISPGAYEAGPTNYGLLNEIMTVEATEKQAVIRMHAFDSTGRYLGVRDSMSIAGKPSSVASYLEHHPGAARIRNQGTYLEIQFEGDATRLEGFLTLSSMDGCSIRRTGASITRLDLSGLPRGLYTARWHTAKHCLSQTIFVANNRRVR